MMPVPDCAHEYARWDAAYVLGSLSATDRREFEAHLAACPPCRSAVAELSGMPALLSQLTRDDVTAIDVNNGDADRALPAEVLPLLLDKVRWQRRRSRLMTWTATAAAAAAVAIGVFIGVPGHSPTSVPTAPQATASLPMAQVATDLLVSTVSLSNEQWGTLIAMNCVCLAPPDAQHDRLAMVVVGRDGSHSKLATWVAHPGHTATPTASVSTPADQIAAVQVVSADSGQVLLQRSL